MDHRARHHPLTRLAGLVAVTVLAVTACGDDSDPSTGAGEATPAPTTEPVIDPGDGGEYHPDLDPADFVDVVDNPYMPLIPGTAWSYEETDGEGNTEHIEVVVTDERRAIQGISATVVRDTVTLDGVVVEDTFDWFAQDRAGNVWYLGEDVDNYEDGVLVDHEGSFEYGVDGALPGIVMLADPQVGEAYRQEFYEGEAEDLGEVLQLDATVSTPAGDFDQVLVTEDWNPLEPEIVEQKFYAPGIGLVAERKVAGEAGEGQLVSSSLLS